MKSLMYVLPVSACLACSVFAQDSDAQTDEETTELEAVDIKVAPKRFIKKRPPVSVARLTSISCIYRNPRRS